MKPQIPPTLAEFWDLLKKHDWMAHMSDDPGVSSRGEFDRKNLTVMAKMLGAEGVEMFVQFQRHANSGPAFGTTKKPLPERPNK